ncbi:MAG: peptidoglycan DD-metalloendopeptidase family protein [Oscillospiraceae bacterium]|nr:peptidoglycan DD-metalloendopeptidase family protein [Oscillospiraceae bacterium]
MNKSTKMEKFLDFLAGKGFYIILGLCVVAIGVSGYVLLFGGNGGGDIEPPPVMRQNTTAPPPTNTLPPVFTPVPTQPPASLPPQGSDRPVIKDDPTLPTLQPPVLPTITPIEPPVSPIPETPPPATPKPKPFWRRPVTGQVILGHDPETLVKNEVLNLWRVHTGVDFAAETGDIVTAAADGTVLDINSDMYLGTFVTIEHDDGMVSTYANLDEAVSVIIGQLINQGDAVGMVGETAGAEMYETAHLHFAIEKDGAAVNPMDYLP